MLWLQQTLPPQPPAGGGSDSRLAQTLTRWLFSSPALLSLITNMARRSGKAPRLPGTSATQSFQKQTYSALQALM